MNNNKLENLIEILKKDKFQHPNATIKHLRVVLKTFATYSTTADTLPPPTLIPVCLFSIPNLFLKLLNFNEQDVLIEPPQKTSLRLCIQLYLRGLLRLLGQCQQEIKHVVVQSISKSILLTPAFPTLSRKWVRALTNIWSTSWENLNLGLRCFVALQKILRKSEDQFYMWTLRRVYVSFFQKCGQLSWKNIEHINFMSNCFCEFVKINPSRSYYVLFGYLRSLALQLGSLNTLKGKLKADLITKLYSQQTLQIIKLLSQVVSRVSHEQISALAYPLVEIINAYEHISESPEYLTLKLHLIQIQLQIMEQTGLYLPHTLQTIIKILRSTPLQKKISKKAGVEGSIELGYHLSQNELKNTNIVNDIFQKTVYCLYWLHSLVSKTLSAPQIIHHIIKLLNSLQFGFIGYKKQLKQATIIFKTDAQKIQTMRSKRKMSLGDKSNQKFLTILSTKVQLQGRNKYEQLQKQYQNIIRAKILAENQDNNKENQDNQGQEDDEAEDQLESGWEEASQGASQFEQQQQDKQPRKKKKKQDQQQSISYQGDPEDAQEAIKQWSEHQWSSQQQLQRQ